MADYKNNFELNVADIELIEDTLRHEIGAITEKRLASSDKEKQKSYEQRIKALNGLLGKFHNQKLWYSQVKKTGVPSG